MQTTSIQIFFFLGKDGNFTSNFDYINGCFMQRNSPSSNIKTPSIIILPFNLPIKNVHLQWQLMYIYSKKTVPHTSPIIINPEINIQSEKEKACIEKTAQHNQVKRKKWWTSTSLHYQDQRGHQTAGCFNRSYTLLIIWLNTKEETRDSN